MATFYSFELSNSQWEAVAKQLPGLGFNQLKASGNCQIAFWKASKGVVVNAYTAKGGGVKATCQNCSQSVVDIVSSGELPSKMY